MIYLTRRLKSGGPLSLSLLAGVSGSIAVPPVCMGVQMTPVFSSVICAQLHVFFWGGGPSEKQNFIGFYSEGAIKALTPDTLFVTIQYSTAVTLSVNLPETKQKDVVAGGLTRNSIDEIHLHSSHISRMNPDLVPC